MNEYLIAAIICILFLIPVTMFYKIRSEKKRNKDADISAPAVTTPNEVDKEIAKQLEEIRKKIKF